MTQEIYLKTSGILVGKMDFLSPLHLDDLRDTALNSRPHLGPGPDWAEIWEDGKPIEKWALIDGEWAEIPKSPRRN